MRRSTSATTTAVSKSKWPTISAEERAEARQALWERQADMAHALRKYERDCDCTCDLAAIDLNRPLLYVDQAVRLSVQSCPPGGGSSKRKVGANAATRAAWADGRLEQRSRAEEKKEASTKTKAIATWRRCVTLRRPTPFTPNINA
jgi:hypothetical protein